MLKTITTAIIALAATASAHAATFNFTFDGTPNGTVTAPIVATGTFTTTSPINAGTVALTDLQNYSFAFTFAGRTFATGDIATPVANVRVGFSDIGNGAFDLRFGGFGGGPFGGSLDFVSATGVLSFQPNFGPLYFVGGFNLGTYEATTAAAAVPEPASWALLVTGFGLTGAVMRRRVRIAAA